MKLSNKKSNHIIYIGKKIIHSMILFSMIFFLTISCGKSSDKSADKASLMISSKGESTSTSSDDCLKPYYGKPENILTKEMMAKYVDFKGSEVKYLTMAEVLNKPELPKGYLSTAFVQAKWKINRQRFKVQFGSILKVNLYNSKTMVDRFYDKYHTRTPEEQAELTKALDNEVAKKTTDINAKKVTDGIGMDFKYVRVEGLGDAAVWEYKVKDLKVLVGDYQFTMQVDLNQGNEFDLEKAKILAQAVIDKVCK